MTGDLFRRLLGALWLMAALTGCSLEYLGILDAGTNTALSSLEVLPRYPSAADWNSYVKATAPSTPCDGTELGPYACLHGGEKKRVSYPAASSCAGYTAEDELGAFDWGCDDSGGPGNLFFFSRGLKPGKGLGDLLEASGWRTNRVTLRRAGAPFATTLPAVWWSNPVQPLPPNDSIDTFVTLQNPGTIYVVSTSLTAQGGYRLADDGTGDRVAVVVLPGATLAFSGSTPTCGNLDSDCLIDLTRSKFFWIEGQLTSSTLGFGVSTRSAGHGVIRKLRASGFGHALGSVNGTLTSSRISLIHVSNNQIGLNLKGSWNVVEEFMASNNGTGLMTGDVSFNNVLQKVTFAFNSFRRDFNGGTHDLTATAISGDITLSSSSRNTFHNLHTYLLDAIVSNQATFSHFFTNQVILNQLNNSKFTGNWLSAAAPTCTLIGSTNPGLDASCANQGASDAVLTSGSGTSATLTPILSEDLTNASDAMGAVAFASLTDWLSFDSPWRAWGSTTLDYCEGAETCRIFDLRLQAADTRVRNTTGSGGAQNPGFNDGEPCPALLHGNVVATDLSATPRTFLRNAIEILGWNEAGDNDGLCESGETCLYTPNFGSYQGEGDFTTKSCVFQNGIVTGVKIYAYPVNGS